jgi:hypothetical protein
MVAPSVRTADGTVIGPDGKILFFSAERFARDICEGSCCFICGAARGAKIFNDEHILPDWILRRYKLHGHVIELPNGRTHQYGTYTIPCCEDCNSFLGRELETPLSEVFAGGRQSVANHLLAEGPHRLFTWMALVFLKIHLKDATLRAYANFQDGDASIATAANYRWEAFHHLHCLARSIYTGATVAPEAYGTLFLLPAGGDGTREPFDLIDLSEAQTLVIRMDDFALCAVFDDACAVLHGLDKLTRELKGPLSFPQVREFAAHLACCNMHLQNRPEFWTRVKDGDPPRVIIGGTHEATPVFAERDKKMFGGFMERVLGELLPKLDKPGRKPEELSRLLTAGDLSFIFDDNGNFIKSA